MDAVLAVSAIDRVGLVAAGASPDNIHVIPIAVDCEALPMGQIKPPDPPRRHSYRRRSFSIRPTPMVFDGSFATSIRS